MIILFPSDLTNYLYGTAADSVHINHAPVSRLLIGVALLANAPERLPEKRKRGREKELSVGDSRPMPPLSSSGGKGSSRAARQRAMAQREEQLAAQKVCDLSFCLYMALWKRMEFFVIEMLVSSSRV